MRNIASKMLCRMLVVAVWVLAIWASPVAASDLTAMLFLSKDITNKPPSWRLDVLPCQWWGVRCNATGSVTAIDWEGFNFELGLGGFANLTLLPEGLQELYLSTPNLERLPPGLQVLMLFDNLLTGSPNFETLPPGMQVLELREAPQRAEGAVLVRQRLQWERCVPSRRVVLHSAVEDVRSL